jgi:hypothetical protein
LKKPELTDPAQLELVRQGRVLTVKAAAADNDLGWSTKVLPGTAAWLSGTRANVILLLPPSEQAALTDMRPGDRMVIRSAAGDARSYMVQRRVNLPRQQTEVLEQTRSGITLVLLGVGGNAPNSPRTVVEGIWRPAVSTELVQGDVRGLGDVATVQLAAVQPITATQPLPPGMREVSITVSVTNLAASPLPLDTLIDALQVEGQFADVTTDVARPTVPPGGKADVPFRYLVPDGAAQAVWHIERRAGERASIPVALPPATTH